MGGTAEEFGRRKLHTNVADFAALYGPTPKVVAALWRLLQTTNNPEARIDPRLCKTDDFFVALHWLRNYPTERRRKIELKIGRSTARKWSWYYAKKIAALKNEIIVWPEEWPTIYTVTVDGVHFISNELNHALYRIDTEAYSHKFGNAGLAYEIAISIFQQQIVWVNGPFKAGTSDKTIFQDHGLMDKIPVGKRVVADKGYRALPEVVSYPNSLDKEAVREFKEQALARHEIFNSRLKRYKILTNRFRSKHNTEPEEEEEAVEEEAKHNQEEDEEEEEEDEDDDDDEEEERSSWRWRWRWRCPP